MAVPKVGDTVLTNGGYGEVVQMDVCCGPGPIAFIRFKDGKSRYVGVREILALVPAAA